MSSISFCVNYYRPSTRDRKSLNEINGILLGVNFNGLPSIGRNGILGIDNSYGVILENEDTSGLFPEAVPHLNEWYLIIDSIRECGNLSESIVNSLLEL